MGLVIFRIFISRKNHEVSAGLRKFRQHGLHRMFVFGTRRSGLDISAAPPGVFLAAATFEKAERCTVHASREGEL